MLPFICNVFSHLSATLCTLFRVFHSVADVVADLETAEANGAITDAKEPEPAAKKAVKEVAKK